jgi:signal transduction histidine kinase
MESTESILRDVALVQRLEAVPGILEAVARMTGMRFTAVARVTEQAWTACAVYDHVSFGLEPGGQLPLESTICNEIRQHFRPIIFGHASQHPIFATHPTPKLYGFESYLSIPIFLSDGSFYGTLCALDPEPATLDDAHLLPTLTLFAQLISAQFESEQAKDRAELALRDANETARLRDQFVAILGHDLRNPVQSISMGAEMLVTAFPEGRERRIVNHIQRSCRRMAELIENVLDFARGRLGEGISVSLERSPDLAADLQHVISEIQRVHPERTIEMHASLRSDVVCDRQRIAQLLSNLVSNAVTHGSEDKPVIVSLNSNPSFFELSVENSGEPIPAHKIDRLFLPFTRDDSSTPQPGLGLGLYIASEIAKAHGGTLTAVSDSHATRFTLRIPVLSVVSFQMMEDKQATTDQL